MDTEVIDARIELIKSNTESLLKEIAELQAGLAEAEKPELRHGDYGYDATSPPGRIVLSLNNKLVTAGNASVYEKTLKERPDLTPSPVLGNIFDDLKALSEPLEEFTMDGLRGTMDATSIEISNGDGDKQRFYIALSTVNEFCLNLRHLVFTAGKEAAK